MILKKEITEKSIEWKVPPETVDKDWVLGHFLSAFYSIDEHKEKLVFKGGTALRKCYFPGYRFSEDLDFTSRTTDYKLTRKLLNKVIKIANSLSDSDDSTLGVKLKINELVREIDKCIAYLNK